jgi:predicted DNA-binding transcriptional regulator YafY
MILCKLQLEYCKNVLKYEIMTYKPKHILFVTGKDWFKDFEFLYELNLDEYNPITTNKIIKKLKLYGIEAERKSVCRDISILKDYGYDINVHSDNKLGYFLGEREFEDWELKVLIDAVASVKFLSHIETERLIKKLELFASKSSQKMLRKVLPIITVSKNPTSTVKISIDTVLHAIKQNKKIDFQYTDIGIDLKPYLRKSGKLYTVNPFALIWSDKKYYLIGNYDEYENISNYRLDKMCV